MASHTPEVWFSAQELADMRLPGLPGSKRKVNLFATTMGWREMGPEKTRPRAKQGGGMEFHVSILPLEARRALIEKQCVGVDWVAEGLVEHKQAMNIVSPDVPVTDLQREQVGARLREEREHLDLTIARLADIGGVTRNTIYNYEQGIRTPDAAFLLAMSLEGADVNYIVTGSRVVSVMDPEESRIIGHFRLLGTAGRKAIICCAAALIEGAA